MPLSPLLEAARDLEAFLVARRWQFCLIGGLAVMRWGEPRLTRDIDVTLLCRFGREDDFTGPLLAAGYRGRIPDAATFARQSRVILLSSATGVPIDIALAALPFEELIIQRSSPFPFAPECHLRTCSAEDLVVLKLFAFRPRDLADAETIALRQRGKLDWDYIRQHLTPLAEVKDEPAILHALDRLRGAH